jgi:hypothetical protein
LAIPFPLRDWDALAALVISEFHLGTSRNRARRKRIGNVIKVCGALCAIGAAVFIIWYTYPHKPKTNGMQEFFTDDDGKTWFADDGTKVAPFDHDGKQAVLAKVYETQNGKQFVGYLMKFTEEARAKVLQTQITHQAHSGPAAEKGVAYSGLLIKRPGDMQWVPAEDPHAKDLRKFAAPDGSTDYLPVRP